MESLRQVFSFLVKDLMKKNCCLSRFHLTIAAKVWATNF